MLFLSQQYPRCPRCKSERVYYSSPKPGDFLFRLMLQAPVRCQACYTRFGTWFQAKKLEEAAKPKSDSTRISGMRAHPPKEQGKGEGPE
jgi:hypothetical protein